MQRFFKISSIALLVLSVPILAILGIFSQSLPDSYIMEDESGFFKVGDYPVHVQANAIGITEVEKSLVSRSGSLSGQLMFGIIPIKEIELRQSEKKEVLISGKPFGIKLFTQGVLVVGTGEVETDAGTVNPGDDAGIKIGDIVTFINGESVESNEEIATVIQNCQGNPVAVTLIRNDTEIKVELRPAQSVLDNKYKAGLWVRDSTAGIGTLTFIDPEKGVYGGLGHGVCDVDTGKIIPMSNGEIVPVNICGITKGLPGSAGELLGFFSDSQSMGTLLSNTEAGVYGEMSDTLEDGTRMKAACKQEVLKGEAQILSTISGETPQLYQVTIERVNYDVDNPSKNMVIRITDPELLELTGGIVQGMSGSPIIQNGKFVGAVTHVFVNDPTSGYGIFAENMLAQCEKITKSGVKEAS